MTVSPEAPRGVSWARTAGVFVASLGAGALGVSQAILHPEFKRQVTVGDFALEIDKMAVGYGFVLVIALGAIIAIFSRR